MSADWMDAAVAKLELVMKAKRKLLAANLLSGRARCSCSPKGTRTMQVRLAPKNKHARAYCAACSFRMME